MKIIIVGGGKVGYYLLRSLYENRHRVYLIEKDRNRCLEIASDYNDCVIWGDGSSLDVLKDAHVETADVIVAATGKDEENLVICQLAKLNYKIAKSIARINNPKNIDIFKKLGVDRTVCSTEVIANMIEWSFDLNA